MTPVTAPPAPEAAHPAPREGKRPLTVVLSLDVEEEGLFGGRYACTNPPVRNTAALVRLAPLLERGLRPTLFCAHSVFTDAASRRMLARLRDAHGAEIGAHLHHWNTPPLAPGAAGAAALTRVPAAAVPEGLMAAKLKTLFAAGRDFQGAPLTSFRMGRWDAHASLWPLLARSGVRADASVRPLHRGKDRLAGPDHFDAPADPYWLGEEPNRLLEMPLTVTPLFSGLPGLARALPAGAGGLLRSSLSRWGALTLLPVQHPLSLLRLTTLLHAARGGRALSLTWHSSEMFPGGAPHMPDEAAVRRFMDKMCAYVDWLCESFAVRFLTLEELRRAAGAGDFAPARTAPGAGDWTWPQEEPDGGTRAPRQDEAGVAPACGTSPGEARP